MLARWLVALIAVACGPRSGTTTFDGKVVCVPEARTIDLGPGSQTRVADAVGACKTWPDQQLITDEVRQTCGVCGFVLDPTRSRAERAGGRKDACCYQVSSPPPRPPPPR